MRIIDVKTDPLREKINNMFNEVFKQLIKSKSAMDTLDKDLAEEIILAEPEIDRMETDISEHCENFLAVYTPVADDLRYIMAINNINPSLERIADIVEKIAKYVRKYSEPLPFDLQEVFSLDELYEITIDMLKKAKDDFFNAENKNLKNILDADKKVNKINKKAKKVLPELIQNYPKKSAQCVNLLVIITKIERIGDLIKNIEEEITFFTVAKNIKHNN